MLGDRLKELRQALNYTQGDLADKIKISKSTIGMYEQNRRTPDIDTLIRFADVFNVSTDYLLERNTHNQNKSTRLKWEEVILSFPNACKLQEDEQDIINYYKQLTKTDQRWIMGQIIDLIKKCENNVNLNIPNAQ